MAAFSRNSRREGGLKTGVCRSNHHQGPDNFRTNVGDIKAALRAFGQPDMCMGIGKNCQERRRVDLRRLPLAGIEGEVLGLLVT